VSGHSFQGHVAVVTGGASGIGASVAERFAEEAAKVALLDCNVDEGQHSAAQIRSRGAACEFFQVDVGIEREVISAIDKIVRVFGSVDHLVNNAGIVVVKGIEESSLEDWDRVMNVNVRSIFLLTKYLLPALRASQYGTIVNLGSVSSFVAQKNTPAYVASKGAVAMLSKSLALDLAEFGIRVNCVCPGITNTPMLHFHLSKTASPDETLRQRIDRVPLNRMLQPREIANAILYLSSEASSGITGTTLLIDGGYLAAAEWSNTSI
jgi:NAD(P)-dependent dehydrogenase (short-subunit alcohol dehydrogenase family)